MDSAADVVVSLASAEQPLRTPAMRRIAREVARAMSSMPPGAVFTVCDDLIEHGDYWSRAAAFEIAHRHRPLRESLDAAGLEQLGRTLDGWAPVDHFARKLSGPAWQRGQLSDARVRRWATSSDFWWRRVGLVSTIALNERQLGAGDAKRTLAICDCFIDDRADLHIKALSWALRELGLRDPDAVRAYIAQHHDRLAPKVVREVRNKLDTGHKQAKPSEAMQRRMHARGATNRAQG